jgi:uncharacterized SAM-binding protein YcdF (DUF218 family)
VDTAFFIASKLIWTLISPSTWVVLLPLIALSLFHYGFVKLSKLLSKVALLVVLLIGFYPVGQWLARPLESFTKPMGSVDSPDGIIVLGGAWLTAQSNYWNGWELNHAAERELAFLMLARQYPNAKLLFTGGSGKLSDQTSKESTFANKLYRDFGIPDERLVMEAESRNTYENAIYSKKLVEPELGERWILITSAYHMPRAIGVFCQQDWEVTPFPVDHFVANFSVTPHWAFAEHLWEVDRVVHEWVGLAAYRLLGKSSAMFPHECVKPL